MKIKELNNNNILKIKIGAACLLVGMHGGIDELEEQILIDFLKTKFGNFNEEEFIEAFKLYAAGELNFKEAVYNNFSPFFVGKILNSYKDYKAKEAAKPKLFKEKTLLPEPEYVHEKQLELLKEFIKDETKKPPDWSKMYEYLENKGVFSFTDEQKQVLGGSIRNELKDCIREAKNKKKQTVIYEVLLSSKMLFKVECRKRIILKHFKNLKLTKMINDI